MTPCPRCGSSCVVLDDVPSCIPCLQTIEMLNLHREQVEVSLVELRRLAATSPPSLLHDLADDTLLWRVQIELIRHQIEVSV